MYNLLVSAKFPVWNQTSVDYRCSPKPLDKRLQQDIFIKSSPVNFKSATSNSAPLKTLRGMIDPYSGITMLSNDELNTAEKLLGKCLDAKSAVKVLSRYTKNMLPTEKKMFSIFKDYAKKNPNGTFVTCLKGLRPDAYKKLLLEEFDVLDSVDDLSRNMSPDLALAVRHKTTRCRDIILKDDPNNPFKRKTLISSLDEISVSGTEKKLFEKLKERARYLPTSGSSENAFIVKYTDTAKPRSHQEIAKRLLRPSLQSAEHIHPDSLGGANSLGNFMLTSAGRNSERGNMPMPKFIEKYPDIPKYTQMHVEQIIDNIHNGKLKGHEDYPYKLKQSLNNESNGLINLDLSSYKYSEEEAENLVLLNKTKSDTKKEFNFDPFKI